MGTPVRPQLPSSSKKTKASYAMISKFSNVRPTFLLQTSNSFQVLSPDFPPLQPSKSFIQASKLSPKNFVVQKQSSPNTISTFLLLLSLLLFHILIVNMSKNPKPQKLLSLSHSSILKRFLKFFLTSFLKESTSIRMIL